jgi:hypothetical protein
MTAYDHHTKDDVVVGDKVRLFMAKPKSPTEVIHYFNNQIDYNGLVIRFYLTIRCIDSSADRWVFVSKANIDHQIKRLKHLKEEFVLIDEFIKDERSTAKLDGGTIEICNINSSWPEEINIINSFCDISIKINTEEMTATGKVELFIKYDMEDYEKLLKNEILPFNSLPSEHYHTARPMYKVKKITKKGFKGILCKRFMSADGDQFELPKKIKFKYDNIFQIRNDDLDHMKYGCAKTEDVTDWSGRCFNPIVRTMLKTGQLVRCKVKIDDKVINTHYVKIIDIINDEEFFGEVQDCYNQGKWPLKLNPDLPLQFAIIKLRFDSISEIPLMWQTDADVKRLEPHLLDYGYLITGMAVK